MYSKYLISLSRVLALYRLFVSTCLRLAQWEQIQELCCCCSGDGHARLSCFCSRIVPFNQLKSAYNSILEESNLFLS